MTRAAFALAHPPAILSADHAAAYIGVCATTLRTASGMPKPRQLTPGRDGGRRGDQRVAGACDSVDRGRDVPRASRPCAAGRVG
jgi:hypothetical protein